jgi:hypothetical protein
MKPKVISIGLFVIAVVSLFALTLGHSWLRIQAWRGIAGAEGATASLSQLSLWSYAAKFILSVVLLFAALAVILAKRYAPQDKNWAYGTIGTVVGCWLHG